MYVESEKTAFLNKEEKRKDSWVPNIIFKMFRTLQPVSLT